MSHSGASAAPAQSSVPPEDLSGDLIADGGRNNMPDHIVLILVVVGFLVFALSLMVWAVAMQRKGLSQQTSAMYSVDESLMLARRGIELAEQSLKAQEEIVGLLRELIANQKPG
jgi:hypothetical protein